MDQEAKNQLQNILSTYRARLLEGQEREAKIKSDRAAFIEGFRSVRAEKIGPVLEEFVVQLNEAGHQASIVDQQEAAHRNGQFTPASIGLRIIPARLGDAVVPSSGGTRVEVTFSANHQSMRVVVSSSNNSNGAIGKRGEYELSDLTTSFVESNVLDTLREAFSVTK